MNEHRKTVGRPFRPGVSGNPGGRPKELREVTELARSQTTDAIKTLVAAMNTDSAPWAARIAAANAILDRGWGRTKESVDMSVRGPTLEQLVLASYRREEQLEPPTIEAEELH